MRSLRPILLTCVASSLAASLLAPELVSASSPEAWKEWRETIVAGCILEARNAGAKGASFDDNFPLETTDETHAQVVVAIGRGMNSRTGKAATLVCVYRSPRSQSEGTGSGWHLQYKLPVADQRVRIELLGIWGSGANDVWVVGHQYGSGGTIVHWDGSAWSSVASRTTEWLYSVWGSSTTDVWAVGDAGTIVHWDGSAWSSVASGTTNSLRSVWGSSTTDVWAVGSDGIIHWDGRAWSRVASGTTHGLNGIWGSSARDVWAVGSDGIIHWNGRAWSRVTSGATHGLNGIWGISARDVWAVGDDDTIVHWNGRAWSRVASGTMNHSIFNAGWGSAANNAWAVGGDGIIHWNGTVWSKVASGTTDLPSCLWGSSASDVWAVTWGGTILHSGGAAASGPGTVPEGRFTVSLYR